MAPNRLPRFKLRRDSAANWSEVDPVLSDGEPGYDKTSKRLKIGDGVTPWSQLNYVTSDTPDTELDLTGHINAELPHPVYDDGPSFELLYQNAKV